MTSNQDLANKVSSKLLQIASQRHFARADQQNPPDGHLYHYTTVVGLQGIVETNCLYASAAYFLNDSNELEYGRKVLGSVLERWLDDHPESRDDFAAELVRDLRAKITDENGREALVHSVYLACFCQRDNVLSQWRAYGQAGGYSIGFPVMLGSIRNLAPESPSYTPLLTRVEYQKERQISRCREILALVLSAIDDPALQHLARTAKIQAYHGPTLLYDFILSISEEMFIDEIIGFKDNAFQEEDEWRLILRPRKFLLSGRDDRGKTPTKTYFRPQRGVAIPFLKLVPLEGSLPIARIRSGPSIDRARARASVRMLLREHKFPDVEFNGSEIAVRLD
jgi:hypothetical protein